MAGKLLEAALLEEPVGFAPLKLCTYLWSPEALHWKGKCKPDLLPKGPLSWPQILLWLPLQVNSSPVSYLQPCETKNPIKLSKMLLKAKIFMAWSSSTSCRREGNVQPCVAMEGDFVVRRQGGEGPRRKSKGEKGFPSALAIHMPQLIATERMDTLPSPYGVLVLKREASLLKKWLCFSS